jgi:uncharacterized protein (TIGR02391 family)
MTRDRAHLTIEDLPSAIEALERRVSELQLTYPSGNLEEARGRAEAICQKVNATLAQVFGEDSAEYAEASVGKYQIIPQNPPTSFNLYGAFRGGIKLIETRLTTRIELLREQLDSGPESPRRRVLRAAGALDLHPEIERAAGQLFRDGHYSNAIEDAVKALNDLVRLRSGESADGDRLMARVFSSGNPILKFNDLQDDPDKDEQKGFMMMFQGAVAGLRNPRAHKLIKDDAERALEFIAFISLLAKLVDGAKKVVPPP